MQLDTPRLLLRELEEADHVFTNTWESDPRVVRYQSNDVRTPAESLAAIRRAREAAQAEPRRLFDLGIVRREDGRLIGRVGLHVARPEHGEAMAWYVLHHDVWGLGYATEAVRAILAFGFERLSLHRIYADCDPRNTASARVLERVDMRREGHLRETWWLKGEWCDSWLYAILVDEWRAARASPVGHRARPARG